MATSRQMSRGPRVEGDPQWWDGGGGGGGVLQVTLSLYAHNYVQCHKPVSYRSINSRNNLKIPIRFQKHYNSHIATQHCLSLHTQNSPFISCTFNL